MEMCSSEQEKCWGGVLASDQLLTDHMASGQWLLLNKERICSTFFQT